MAFYAAKNTRNALKDALFNSARGQNWIVLSLQLEEREAFRIPSVMFVNEDPMIQCLQKREHDLPSSVNMIGNVAIFAH